MHPRKLLFVLFASLAFATTACVGELEPNGPGDDDDDDMIEPPPPSPDAGTDPVVGVAEEMFDLSVKPILQRCSGEACHSGISPQPLKYLGASGLPDDYYASITQFPSVTGDYQAGLANVLLKVDAGHEGQVYAPTERQAIIDWLNAENLERNDTDGDGQVDPPPAGDPLAMWSGCLTLANWDATEMYRWADKGSDEGPCRTCHQDGAFRFNTNANDNTMFEMNRYRLYIIGFFTVKVETDGTQTVIPAYDKITRMGDGSTLHPRFNTDPASTNYQRLQDFYALTLQAQQAGLCGAPVYPDPL